jgi:hypothetical protein
MSISTKYSGCTKSRPEGWTDEDEKTLQAKFTHRGCCGCDGALDSGCPWCTPEQFEKWWAERLLMKERLMNALLGSRQPAEKCAECQCDLSSFVTGKNPSPKGTVCDDCHYDAIGDEIDKHPIGGL